MLDCSSAFHVEPRMASCLTKMAEEPCVSVEEYEKSAVKWWVVASSRAWLSVVGSGGVLGRE